ncbi:SPAG5 protein, partial [Vireo altiloquus]|nr:SPAG5 protein [Vireo altiloquus]
DGSAGPLHCQGSPAGAKSPGPVPPEQSPPSLPPIEASGLEPAGSEATVTPVTSPESTLGAVSWMLPLVWLEKTLNTSFLAEALQHSLPLHKPQQDASSNVTSVPTVVTGTSTTPVSTVVTGTSTTPVPTVVTGTSTTPVSTVVTGTSTTPDMPPWMGLWHVWAVTALSPLSVPSCPREQLKTLPRAELEGRLESTLIIIEALSLQLRDWQESQRLRPGVGPAKQRDTFTQTDITHPKGVRVLSEEMPLCPPQPRCRGVRRGGTAQPLAALPVLCALGHTAGQCQQCHGSATLSSPWRCLPSQREQVGALVFQSRAMLERVPGKLRSCLEEVAATKERAEE